jgi:hypothetical protein
MVIEAFRCCSRSRADDGPDRATSEIVSGGNNSRSRARDFIHDEKIRLGISLVARVNHGYPVTDSGAVGSIQTN